MLLEGGEVFTGISLEDPANGGASPVDADVEPEARVTRCVSRRISCRRGWRGALRVEDEQGDARGAEHGPSDEAGGRDDAGHVVEIRGAVVLGRATLSRAVVEQGAALHEGRDAVGRPDEEQTSPGADAHPAEGAVDGALRRRGLQRAARRGERRKLQGERLLLALAEGHGAAQGVVPPDRLDLVLP